MEASRTKVWLTVATAATMSACGQANDLGPSDTQPAVPSFAVATTGQGLVSMMDAVNVGLAGQGAGYRVVAAEYVTDGAGGEAGGTVFAQNVGNKRLIGDFVPGDVRRQWSPPAGNSINYAIDRTIDATPPSGLSPALTDAAIVRAMDSWNAVVCSELGLARNPDFGIDIGVVASLFGFGGSPFVFADVQHAGWRDINFTGGILGVTFSFNFVDGAGQPTDIDGNGEPDIAFREIYYDPSWIWADNGVNNVDVESVAVHEAGHALSQAHFGKVWLKNDGSLAASPRAVMNALYAGPFRSLAGTDNGGHCSNWASWPNN